jgi:ABC-2 type transport system permease protein
MHGAVRMTDRFRRPLADLWLLLSLRRQVGWNTFRARKPVARIFTVVGLLWIGGSALAVSIGAGYLAGAVLRRFPGAGLEPLLPGLILTAVAALVLVSSFGVALGSLFLANDLELLMAAPVDRRAVFASKILDGLGVNYALVVLTALPALVTYGLGLRYGPLYYLLAAVAVLGTPLLPAGLAALLVMLVARFAPARRVREALGLVAALFGIGCSVIGQTARFWTARLGDLGGDATPQALLDRARAIQALPLPSLVAGRGLAAAGAGAPGRAAGELAGFLLLTLGSFVACTLLADRLYASGWVRMQSGGVARRGRGRPARDAARAGRLDRAPAWVALALKDWRTIPRDLRNFAQLLAPLFLLPVVYINLLAGDGRRRGDPLGALDRLVGGGLDPAGIPLAVGVLTASLLVCNNLALTGISREGRSWWLLKAAPISGFELLRGKYLAALAPFAALSTPLLAGAALWRGFSPLGFLYGWFGVELLGAGMLALATGLGVPWARLDWDDPRRMSSGWGSLLALAGSALLGVVAGGLLCLPLVAQVFRPALVAPAWLVGIAGAFAVTAAAGWLGFRLGLRFLPRVGEA